MGSGKTLKRHNFVPIFRRITLFGYIYLNSCHKKSYSRFGSHVLVRVRISARCYLLGAWGS